MSNASNPYGQQEGSSVQEMMEYHPERMAANGNPPHLEPGEPEQVWDEYGLEIVPLNLNGDDSGRRWVMRNGEFIADVSDRYRLLPNEKAVQTADRVADELGAVPFNDFDGEWYVKLDDHVFQDDEGRRSHALYAWDDPVDIDGSGDEVQLGFAVHNSIDSSMGFQVGLFTFRHACANMVMMGIGGQGMSFDQRDVLDHAQQRHTKSLDIDNLRAWIEDTVQYGSDVIEAYQAWADRELTTGEAMSVVKRARAGRLSKGKDIPDWMVEAIEEIEYTEETLAENQTLDGEQFPNGLPEDYVADIVEGHVPEAERVWDTYNSLTENIWHNPDTGDRSKMRKMQVTHQTFDPSPDQSEIKIR